MAHLRCLQPADVVVYDRGYYSFPLLRAHLQRRLHAVFRLKTKANAVFEQFRNSCQQHAIVWLAPSEQARQQLAPSDCQPCRVRLLRYTAGQTEFLLATTLLVRRRYPRQALADLYHGRWSIEELDQVSKQYLAVEQFHGQSERLVRQELSAHCSLIAMRRLCANQTTAGFAAEAGKPPLQANFRNSLRTVGRHLEGLFLTYASTLSETVTTVLDSSATCRQRERPHRSYERVSHKPVNKWRKRKPSAAPHPA